MPPITHDIATAVAATAAASESDDSSSKPWKVRSSRIARNTFNPIRNIIESMEIKPNPAKKMISLSIGDPTVFGNLKPHEAVVEAVRESLDCGKYNGYGSSTGFPEACEAVAKHVSVPGAELKADDVILCSGCSCALDLCITALADPGQNILIPRPGFSLYATLAKGLGVDVKEYDLLPERGWEADLEHMESLVDADTVAIVVNNPSNPCGSVFDEAHLRAILSVAERHRLPIIADEIYDHFVFPGHRYIPIASLTTAVPVLSCGGLTKRFLVPGWRLGWITVHDRNGVFAEAVKPGLKALSQRIIGANTLVQGALPAILRDTPQSFFDGTIATIQANAELAYERLRRVPGLRPVMPAGAMYMMVGVDARAFPAYNNDLEIVEALVQEQSVFCLPGKCFNLANYVRIVLTVPIAQMEEACDRIAEFCAEHLNRACKSMRVDAREGYAERMAELALKEREEEESKKNGEEDSAISSESNTSSAEGTPTPVKKNVVPSNNFSKRKWTKPPRPLLKRDTVTRLV